MDKFIKFISKIYILLLFIVLEAIAINFYANSNNYTRAKFLTASNIVVGNISKNRVNIKSYFSLRKQNNQLIEEITRLNNKLSNIKISEDSLPYFDNQELSSYFYTSSQVISNSINKQRNYITLSSGLREGLEANMAVVTPKGEMVGYILSCSDRFASVCSILNTTFITSGKILGQDYFGSIYWDGKNHNFINMKELPKYTQLKKGDTVVSTNYSSIFPEGVIIGTVESFAMESETYYNVRIRLSASLASLTDVLVINYQHYAERQLLEKNTLIQ